MRFFISDTHFGHARINELAGRPFDSVEEMNEYIIDRWNAAVGVHDQVFHLGDVALGSLAESLPILSRLNGQKFLVAGNHDRVFKGNKPAYIERFWPEYRKYFAGIWNGDILMTLNDGTVVKASHFPYHGDSTTDERYPEFRPVDDGHVLLHGHVHEMWLRNGRQINVGVDVWDFNPVREDVLIEMIRDGLE